LLRTGCVPAHTAPVWVPLEDRVQLALLLAKGYAALDSRPSGGRRAPAPLYPAALKGWGNTVSYHERLKPSYYILQKLWQ